MRDKPRQQPQFAANQFVTALDRRLLSVFPSWGARRIRARLDHELRVRLTERAAARLSTAWEAADSDSTRGHSWMTSRLSSNDQLTNELDTTVHRALELYRNDVYASSAINGRVDNVICTGIRPQSRVLEKRGVITGTQAAEFNAAVERAFEAWAFVEQFFFKQRQLERCCAIYGESFAVMSDDDDPRKPVTLALQVINPQRVPYQTEVHKGASYRLGMRVDGRNRPVSYLIRRRHPGEAEQPDDRLDPVDADRVCHNFEELFPGQLRGVPWMAPAMTRLKDLKDFAEANLIAEQIAACHAGFVKGITDPVALAESGRVQSNLQDYQPGSLQYLGDGEDIVFSNPNRPGTTLAPYMRWALQGIAAALRYPYELLIKEFTNNFSGGRLALIDGRMTFKTWQHMMIVSTLRPLWERFVDQCVYQGVVKVDLLRYEQHRSHFTRHAWIPPGWPWVDPEKEVRADLDAIAGGLLTETESLSTRGRDFEETLATREAEQIAKMQSEARLMAVRQSLGLPVAQEASADAPQTQTEERQANASA